MDKQLSPGLKTTFLIHANVATLFGLAYLLIPKKFGSFVNWPVMEPEAYRIIGAAILAFAASSWLAYSASAWEQVKIVVQMEITWTILATLVLLYGIFFAGLPAFAWVNAIIFVVFAVLFIVFYSRR